MHRQRSILSYLQKPSSVNQNPAASSDAEVLHRQNQGQFQAKQPKESFSSEQFPFPVALDPSPDIRGTDAPPEKTPRQVFPVKFSGVDDSRPSLFTSIKHKFARVGEQEQGFRDRNLVGGGSSNGCSTISSNGVEGLSRQRQEAPSQVSERDTICKLISKFDEAGSSYIESEDTAGPDTPAMRPLVPRFKRIQEGFVGFDDKKSSLLLDSSKRAKLHVEQGTDSSKIKSQMEVSEATGSKFEWLNSSVIRDANGRRPGDALYDKRTLYIPPDALKKMTPSQKQYWSVKCQYMDVLIFFKVGKFYELYELDADIAHKELDWKITFSGVSKCRQVGISENGIDDAVQKLIARGYKVGRIEQLQTSDEAKSRGKSSVIQRKPVQVVTRSTPIDGNIGDAVHLLALKEVNCGIDNGSTVYGFAFVDCATLKFWVGSISDDASCAALGALLMQVSPKEVIYENRGLSKESHKALRKYSTTGSTMIQLTPVPSDTDFVDASEIRKLIQSKKYFKRSSTSWHDTLDGVIHNDITTCALGGLVGHLSRLMLDDVICNGDILPYEVYKGYLRIDGQTLVNLEIFGNSADGGPAGTLYKYLDSCITSSGKRLLRNWICHPLKVVGKINDRLDVVEELIEHSEITFLVSQFLRKLPDIERLLGRVKAIVGSSAALLLPLVGKKLLKQRVKVFGSLVKGLRIAIDLLMSLQQKELSLSSLPKVLDIPVLRGNNGLNQLISQFEAAVDSDFPNFQDHEVSDTDAETLSALIDLFIEKASQWSQVVHALNCIDVLRSFAVTANSSCGSMCRPVFVDANPSSMMACQETGGPVLKIKGLWHPYALGENGGMVVPNDIHLGEDTTGNCPGTLLLTGPNMGGKSTLLRATCLAVILASCYISPGLFQCLEHIISLMNLGCFVPSEMCVLSPVDIIFTRLGATDRIMSGESTFFIECTETASVLQNATRDSLVLLDELGRGTSTFDGYAIAYAVFRHLVEKVNCRLLFATHYHSLTKEFASHPNVTLQHMACSFKPKTGSSFKGEQELVFHYRLTSGACPESYGLQVALMAGISKKLVEVASKASQAMKKSVGENFKSSEQRSSFSTLHEEWLKNLLAVSQTSDYNLDEDDCDTFLCLWHELKNSYRAGIYS